MEVGVADQFHGDGQGAVGDVGARGDDDDEVAAVDAGVGFFGGEHGLEQDEEAAAVVGADGEVEVDVGVEDHAGEGVVEAGGGGFVFGAVLDPEGVEADVFGEGADEGQNVEDADGVGRELGGFGGGGEERRRG